MLVARALYYALIIAFIIALSSSLLISLAYLQRLQQINAFDGERMVRNLQSSMAILKSKSGTTIEEQAFDLYGEGRDSVTIGKYEWGLFHLAYAKIYAYNGFTRDTLVKAFFLGNSRDSTMDAALYLTDMRKPLGLAGKTSLKGLCFLPEADVKSAYIDGVSYMGAQLVDGEKSRSTAFLPAIHKDRIEDLSKQFFLQKGTSFISPKIEQSFTDSTVYIRGKTIYLDDLHLRGNIIVIAEKEIYVGANSYLEDIQLYAPVIRFEDGFRGSLQAFALSEIQVGKNCQLEYPSVLGLMKTEFSQKKPIIYIAEKSLVEGLVFIKTFKYTRFPPKLRVAESALIHGQAFINGSFELRGAVYGNVSCDQFNLKTNAAVYDNHLLNATIDHSQLSQDYVAPLYAASPLKYGNVKWVD